MKRALRASESMGPSAGQNTGVAPHRSKRVQWTRSVLWWVLPLSCGLVLRLIGLRHGEPDLIFHPDVAKQALVAVKAVAAGRDVRVLYRDNVELTLYPYGTAVLAGHGQAIYRKITGRPGLAAMHRWHHAVALRYVAIGLYLLSVALLLPALARRTTWLVAGVTGLLLLAEPHHAQLSHYGMNDVPLVASLLLAWLCALNMAEAARRNWLPAGLCGLCLGIGFGIKYQAVLGGLLPFAAMLLVWRRQGTWRALIAAAAVAAAFIVGACYAQPLLARDPAYFFSKLPEFMRWQASILGTPVPASIRIPRNLHVLWNLLTASGRWFLLFGAAGFAWRVLCTRDRRPFAWLVMSGLALSTLLLLLTVTGRDFVRPNDLLPIYAFLALACAGLLADHQLPRPVLAAVWVAAGLSLATFGQVAVRDSLALARTDTRVRARDWCRANLPVGASVIREAYVLPVARPDLSEMPRRYLADPDSAEHIRAGTGDILIASSLASGRFFDPLSAYYDVERQQVYRAIEAHYERAAIFQDRELLHAHPTITVYRRR